MIYFNKVFFSKIYSQKKRIGIFENKLSTYLLELLVLLVKSLFCSVNFLHFRLSIRT
ncbi:unnamed protein product [Schistosoma mattheei]|uniref:Uncharacterized protein n=1 Tax=Schistosoma mattheei TaxID=31246 RepID=A0A183PUB5_9TREM|nr:unnamed protein product [Schistosoma mattheei]